MSLRKFPKNTLGLAETLREVVFGAEDGLVSTLGVVTGVAAGTRSTYIVVLTGLVVIAVEAISMAAGSFLSSRAARGVEEREISDVLDYVLNNPRVAERELMRIYVKNGLDKKLAHEVSHKVIKNPHMWKNELVMHKLGFSEDVETNPVRNALFMGVSYVIAGSITIVPYFFFDILTSIIISVFFTVIALFVVGVLKSRYTRGSWVRDGLEMVFVSFGAAILGFMVGEFVRNFASK